MSKNDATERALMDAIHRIRLIEDEVRKTDNYVACTAVTACKWAVQDVLEEHWTGESLF